MAKYFLFAIIFVAACKNTNTKPSKKSSISSSEVVAPKPLYNIMKLRINSLRHTCKNNSTAQIEQAFYAAVVDSIMPYWYGTSWDFNGTTQEPQKGAIACGYFVSTVLRDAGLHINRIKMGQASSENIIHQLAQKNDTKLFYDKPLDIALNYIKNKGKGIYLAGLDSHVGFLVNDANNIWFIHSKWINPKAVVKELAKSSGVLASSRYKMIAKISCNPVLLKSWQSD
jgi:hypothetical protein